MKLNHGVLAAGNPQLNIAGFLFVGSVILLGKRGPVRNLSEEISLVAPHQQITDHSFGVQGC